METDVVDKDLHSWSVRLIIALISAVRSCVICFCLQEHNVHISLFFPVHVWMHVLV